MIPLTVIVRNTNHVGLLVKNLISNKYPPMQNMIEIRITENENVRISER
jgi:hypothetical protein